MPGRAIHLASTLDPIASMIKAVAAGQSVNSFRLDELDEMNARHAQDYAGCTKAETIELLEKNAARAVATVRELRDDQLARSATLLQGRRRDRTSIQARSSGRSKG